MALTLKRPLEFEPHAVCSPRPLKRRRCVPMCVTDDVQPQRAHTAPPSPKHSIEESPFYGAANPITKEDIAQYVKEEIRRLRRRRVMPRSCDAESSSAASGKPIFTYKQMMQLCATLVAGREEQVRAACDGVLSTALAEQHQDCVGFTQARLQTLASVDTPSYMS